MKIKELQKTVNVAWSPAQLNDILLAAGTSAQQFDASNSGAILEIYTANLSDPGYDMVLKGSTKSQFGFHKVIWSPFGHNDIDCGLIVGGCENGHIQIYNAKRILRKEDQSMVAHRDKHTGPVRALDFNPFQTNLLASGASESEILIWDLNNPEMPMTPGTKTQPQEDVQSVLWNRQVQHILASVFSTKCVIWDLRKNEPIIKLSDTQSRVRWQAVQWHPDVATQLWLASEDDQAPVIQLWDLRYATSPTKTVHVHQRGVLGLAWCHKDTDLMVSCAKDNKILCWNPNAAEQGQELLGEVATPIQWYSDVQWCPKNPALIVSSSPEGNVSIYSLFGGHFQHVQTSNKIADSFPGMSSMAEAPTPQNSSQTVYTDLIRPPKWMKKPIGASFGFGGKLIIFNNDTKSIIINQVITEPELVSRAQKLEHTLSEENFIDYCRQKADQMPNQHGRFVWYFLKAYFEQNPRGEMINLLGYNSDDMATKFKPILELANKDQIDQLSDNMIELNQAPTDNAFDSISTMGEYLSKPNDIPYKIKHGDDIDGLISQALLTGNIEAAVELCIHAKRWADAIIIAMNGGAELLARAQMRYLRSSNGFLSNIISAMVQQDWTGVIEQCTVDSWKEAMVAILTHTRDEASLLCDQLGKRLHDESNRDAHIIENAILCFICSGNIERLVDIWMKHETRIHDNVNDLQELIEVVMLMQKALELQGRNINVSGEVANILSTYAGILAAQGELSTALSYLSPSEDPHLNDLRDRLYYALGHKQQQQQPISRSQKDTSKRSLVPQIDSGSQGVLFSQTTVSPPLAQPNNHFNPNSMNAMNPLLTSTLVSNSSPPPSRPGRPPSTGGSQGPASTRNKYVLDPSVMSGGVPYGHVPAINSYQNQPAGGYVNYPSGVPPLPAQNSNQFQSFATPEPIVSTGTNYMMRTDPTGVEMAKPAMPISLQNYASTQSGWNDPPALRSRSTNQPHEYKPVAAITHPLFGTDQQQPSIASQNNGYFDPTNLPNSPNSNINHYQNSMSNPVVQQLHPQTGPQSFPPANNFQNQPIQQFNLQPQSQPPTLQQMDSKSLPTATPEKLALPEEYVYWQTVFNELRTQCISSTQHPQTKRKLEDVAKRLEYLYDMLRENRLTENTLTSLNQLVQLVQIGDYANGLGLHTQMVSGPDFSQIASFMPGIKVLLQSAMTLQVYLK